MAEENILSLDKGPVRSFYLEQGLRFWSLLLNKGKNEDIKKTHYHEAILFLEQVNPEDNLLSPLPHPCPPRLAGQCGLVYHHLLHCLPELCLLHSIAVKNCFTEQAFASRSGLVLSVAMLSCLQAFFFSCNVVKCRFLSP